MLRFRLNKYIAHAGYCSRRTADTLIKSGKVKVNNEIITNCATHVTDRDLVEVNNTRLKLDQTRLWIFYKPVGLITSHKDSQNRKTVFDYLSKRPEIQTQHIVSVGRLDINSEGLLLLTNDGDFANYLSHPKTKLERVYRVRVYGDLQKEKLKKLEKPFSIKGIHYGAFKFLDIQKGRKNHWLTIKIFEGKNREIRKAMEFIGLKVSKLIREWFGPYSIDNLKVGDIREVQVTFSREDLM